MTKLHVSVIFLRDICLSKSPFCIIKSSRSNQWMNRRHAVSVYWDWKVTSVLQLKSQMVSFYLAIPLEALKKCQDKWEVSTNVSHRWKALLSKSNSFHHLVLQVYISDFCTTVLYLLLQKASIISYRSLMTLFIQSI